MAKEELKQKAIELRKQGKTYSEILKEITVARSTLSLWLRDVGLSTPQKQRISEKKILSQKRGAEAQRNKRIIKQIEIFKRAEEEIGKISKRELWLIGTALYWAEGTKEKENSIGARVQFSNSDPYMIMLFIKWLKECIEIEDKDISADLYIHESYRKIVPEKLKIWRNFLKLPDSFIKNVYFKKDKIRTNRRNTGVLYIGLLRVNIRASSDLNRRITGWTKGIIKNCEVV